MSCRHNNKILQAVSWLCPDNKTEYSSFTGKKTQKPISVFDHFYSLRNKRAGPSPPHQTEREREQGPRGARVQALLQGKLLMKRHTVTIEVLIGPM